MPSLYNKGFRPYKSWKRIEEPTLECGLLLTGVGGVLLRVDFLDRLFEFIKKDGLDIQDFYTADDILIWIFSISCESYSYCIGSNPFLEMPSSRKGGLVVENVGLGKNDIIINKYLPKVMSKIPDSWN